MKARLGDKPNVTQGDWVIHTIYCTLIHCETLVKFFSFSRFFIRNLQVCWVIYLIGCVSDKIQVLGGNSSCRSN